MNKFYPIILGIFIGIITGFLNIEPFFEVARVSSKIYLSLLNFISLPIIFLAIISTITRMEGLGEAKKLGFIILQCTFFTTLIAATVALVSFILINPVLINKVDILYKSPSLSSQKGIQEFIIDCIPSNIIKPFLDKNVIGVVLISFAISVAILSLPQKERNELNSFFSSMFAAVMKITNGIIKIMPIAVWAFMTLFIYETQQGVPLKGIGKYLLALIVANLIQAVVVLPLFLKIFNISPLRAVRGMFPALSVAFFSKSSSATLPTAIQCVTDNLGVSQKVAGFSLPLCTIINMNACASFILISVLFVSGSNGVFFTWYELVGWVFIATLGAAGSAGIPMGCYFIASAFLSSMQMPLNLLGIILPFYGLLDMLETAINVWSDSCITLVVEKTTTRESRNECFSPKLFTDV